MFKLASREVLGKTILFVLEIGSLNTGQKFGPGSNYPHFEK